MNHQEQPNKNLLKNFFSGVWESFLMQMIFASKGILLYLVYLWFTGFSKL